MRKLFKWVLPCLCMTALTVGCNDDNGEPERQGKPVTELTPDENKKELEDIGRKLLSKVTPADHETLILTATRFIEISDELEIESKAPRNVPAVMQTISAICSKSDLGKMLTFTRSSSDLYKAAQYYGIYTYNETTKVWDRTNSDDRLEFRYKFNSKDAVIKLVASGNETNVEINDDEQVAIPENVSLVATLGATELCKVTVATQLDNNQHTARVEAELSASGYTFHVVTDASGSVISGICYLGKGDEILIAAQAEVNGKNMTNPSDDDIDNPQNMFRKASTQISILDDMNISASCSDIKGLADELDNIDHSGDQNGNKYNDEKSTKAEANLYNKYMAVDMRYNGSDAVIAKFNFQAYLDYSYSYNDHSREYWEIEPIITFTQDNSSYSMDDYFDETSFQSLIDMAEDLYDEYESYLD